ncbi:MAG: hypothetical protein C4542_08250 [Dehalococcoidia bacterium]|nr:MAG: hypothetical protein C4542_08250 [Dehalococcoidia bacterium]
MLTKEQLAGRAHYIGASEVPALFGEHIKLTGTDLWLMKTFPLEHKELNTAAGEMGDDFEEPLIKYAIRELGVQATVEPERLFAIHPQCPILAATLDALIVSDDEYELSLGEAIEAKTTSINDMEFGGKDNEWGEPGTDQIPSRVILQCQAQIACHNLKRVHVVALLGRMGLKRELYKVERNEQIIQAIIAQATAFWNTYVIPKVQPPEDSFGLGGLDIIKRVIRQPQSWATVPDDLINDWDAKRTARLEAEKLEKEALSRVLTPLGDAEGVKLLDGRVLTYFPTVKSILDQSRLKAEAPEIYNSFLKESVSRTPRIKQGEA